MDPGETQPGPSSTAPILVASTGEPFDRRVLDRAVELARQKGTSLIRVISTARVFGTGLGLQHPGLFPTKQEWQAQADLVADAVRIVRRAGFDAKGRVVGTRHPSKAITIEAVNTECTAIVIGGRPVSRWQKLLWQDEVGLLRRRTNLPIHVVELPAKDTRAGSVRDRGRSEL
jgi:nucleotide-binding universal stress UspA family protein